MFYDKRTHHLLNSEEIFFLKSVFAHIFEGKNWLKNRINFLLSNTSNLIYFCNKFFLETEIRTIKIFKKTSKLITEKIIRKKAVKMSKVFSSVVN
jgi:hypothetical protein